MVTRLNKVVQRCLYSYQQRYLSSQCQNVVDSLCAQQILTSVMTNIVVDKSTDNTEPLSICFLPQYSMLKKVLISKHDQNHNTKKSKCCL